MPTKSTIEVQATGPVKLYHELTCDCGQTAPPGPPPPPPPPGGPSEGVMAINGPLPPRLLTGSSLYEPIDHLPGHPLSRELILSFDPVHPSLPRRLQNDWGVDPESGKAFGIPYAVGHGWPLAPIRFSADGWPGESDQGPLPIPPGAPIEGEDNPNGDRHLCYYDDQFGQLIELGRAFRGGGGYECQACAVFRQSLGDLQRPHGNTSADAAGLPITPLLVRLDELERALAEPNPADRHLGHALRGTLPRTGRGFLSPAQHYTSNHGPFSMPTHPPMGMRARAKKSLDLAMFNEVTQVIVRTLQIFGWILADNGAAWFVTGTADLGWAKHFQAITETVSGKLGLKQFAGPLFEDNWEIVAFADSDVVTAV